LNQQQVLGLARTLLTMAGTALVAKGVISQAELSPDVDIIVTAIGAVSAAGSVAWNLWSKTHKNTIAAAASLPKVQTIVTTDQKTADNVPNDKVIGPTGS
jgi:hypothetical protein